jgi:multiple sugar transport system permease protein
MAQKKWTPYLYLLPVLIPFAIFFAYPFITAIYYSFTKWNMYGPAEWVGFRNYHTLLFKTDSVYYKDFWNGMGNTFKFALFSVPPLIIFPFILAVLLNHKVKGTGFFQSVFYLPGLFSVATITLMWQWLLDGRFGAVNKFLGVHIPWAVEQPYTWIALIGMTVWWTIGGNMVIYLAGMSDISKSLYEAASIDGAGELKKTLYITMPGLKHQFSYTFVLTTIASFNVFGQTYMFSKGGPANSTKTVIMYIREYAFANPPVAGMAVAMSVLLGVVICLFSIIQYFLLSRTD